jgi:hypothetical protein
MIRRATLLVLFSLIARASSAIDGEPDEEFGDAGQVTWLRYLSGGPIPQALSVVPAALATSDSHAYSVGTHGGGHLEWTSFDRSGDESDAFCAQATETLFPFGVASRGNAALIDSSGNLLVGGDLAFLGSETQRHALLARFDLGADGCELDDSYGDDGWAVFDDESFCDTESCTVVALGEIRRLTGAVAQSRIIALVRSVVAEDALSRYFLLALTPSGQIITSFGSQGWRELNPSGLGALAPEADLEIDARGRIGVAVTRWDPAGDFDNDVYFLRYSATGVLDTSIGSGGLVDIADFGGEDDVDDSKVRSLRFDAEGRIVVGYHGNDGRLRLRDLATGANVGFGPGAMSAPEVVPQGNARLLAVGNQPSQDGFRLSRYLVSDAAQLTPDPSFSDDGTIVLDIDLGASDTDDVADATLWHGRPLVLGWASCATIPFERTCGFVTRSESSYIFADGFDAGTAANWSTAAP